MRVLLHHLIQMERKEEIEIKEADLKTQVLLHNPQMYLEVYGDEDKDSTGAVDDEDVDYILPESPEDAIKMLSELQSQGLLS